MPDAVVKVSFVVNIVDTVFQLCVVPSQPYPPALYGTLAPTAAYSPVVEAFTFESVFCSPLCAAVTASKSLEDTERALIHVPSSVLDAETIMLKSLNSASAASL